MRTIDTILVSDFGMNRGSGFHKSKLCRNREIGLKNRGSRIWNGNELDLISTKSSNSHKTLQGAGFEDIQLEFSLKSSPIYIIDLYTAFWGICKGDVLPRRLHVLMLSRKSHTCVENASRLNPCGRKESRLTGSSLAARMTSDIRCSILQGTEVVRLIRTTYSTADLQRQSVAAVYVEGE